jgi:hypothetical protein
MKTHSISISRAKDFLAKRLVRNMLQIEEEELYNLIRYESVGGFEHMSNEEVFSHLVEIFPEFKFIKYVGATKNLIEVGVKEEYIQSESGIMTDIARIIQMKF